MIKMAIQIVTNVEVRKLRNGSVVGIKKKGSVRSVGVRPMPIQPIRPPSLGLSPKKKRIIGPVPHPKEMK